MSFSPWLCGTAELWLLLCTSWEVIFFNSGTGIKVQNPPGKGSPCQELEYFGWEALHKCMMMVLIALTLCFRRGLNDSETVFAVTALHKEVTQR